MRATGSYVTGKSRSAYTGLGDGPLLVVAALNLPGEERDKMLKSIFVANPKGLAKLSSGHRKVAQEMQPKFAKLETYYRSAASGAWLGPQGAGDRRGHQPVDTGELFAHVVPHQYAAAAQQPQPDHGLRGDDRDRVGFRFQVSG